MKILLKNQAEIIAPGDVLRAIAEACTFENPAFEAAARHGRSVGNIPKNLMLATYSEDGEVLTVPTGLLGGINANNFCIADERRSVPTDIIFNGTLRDYQQFVIDAAALAGGGVIVASTGAGKTVTAIALAAKLKQRTLVLVKSRDLADQWRAEIKRFTGLNAGLVGAGVNTEGVEFTVAITQTLAKRDLSQLEYGLVVLDEAHGAPANQCYEILNDLDFRYKFGLSATPNRRDGLEFLMHACLGPAVPVGARSDSKANVMPVKIVNLQQPFEGSPPRSWSGFVKQLSSDTFRNDLIVDASIKFAAHAGVLVFTNTVEHAEALHRAFEAKGFPTLMLHGKLTTKVRARAMEKAVDYKIIIGTFSLLSEGIDWPHVGAVILASPLSASVDRQNPTATRLQQAIGRARRPFPGKKMAFVVDIIDECPFGISAAKKREIFYKTQNFEVLK